MPPSPSDDITTLLKAWRGGDTHALEQLTPKVYDHLRQLGRQYARRERADLRGDASSLVHEAYLRLVDARALDWQDRAHFFTVSARMMRRILVDAARTRRALKRGGAFQRVDPPSGFDMDALPAPVPERAKELCALDDALERLAAQDPRRAQVIELRFFGGRSVEETAEALGVSPQPVMRDWRLARAWLAVELQRTIV
jgi:RNA polymerase sigma factor (TIGR02999 family)